MLVAGLLLVLAIGATGLLLGAGKELGERHRPVAFGETLDFANAGFDDYAAWSRRRIFAGLSDIDPRLMDNLAPFVLRPGADCPREADGRHGRGIVLTHGEYETPYSMLEFGRALQARCFVVYGILLPGHGAGPGALPASDWRDWAAAQALALRELAGDASTLFLGGHSAGATLALFEAAANAQVDGLILFSPLLEAPAPNHVELVSRLYSSWLPAAAWARVGPDESPYLLESRPHALSAQIRALVDAAARRLEAAPLGIPVLTVASMDDATASGPATLAFMAAQRHENSLGLLFSREEIASTGKVKVYSSHRPDAMLLSLSHLGLMIPNYHGEFGWYGAYRDCLHYLETEEDKYARCKAGGFDYFAEVDAASLEQGVIQRIGFNPFYNDLLRELDAFLGRLPRADSPAPAPTL